VTALAQIHAEALTAAADAERARIADPLTGPRPRHVFDAEDAPIYRAVVAELGVPGQGIDPGPVVAGELATAAIDMSALLGDVEDGFVLTAAGDIEHVEVTA
jgi:hypothetical protein